MVISRRQSGFSLVELLAVVLILVALAMLAIPQYIGTRKSSAARACRANIAAIAKAESAYATRFGVFAGKNGLGDTTTWCKAYNSAAPTGNNSGLIGAPEGLSEKPICPLKKAAYFVRGNSGGGCTITCQDAAQHQSDTGSADASPWTRFLRNSGTDTTNQ